MPTAYTSVEDITSLQSVKKISLQLYGMRKATLAVFFYIISLFGDAPVNPPLLGLGHHRSMHQFSLTLAVPLSVLYCSRAV